MQSEKFLRLIQELVYMHSTCPVEKRSKFISIVSTVYSRTELINFGFKISNTQYKKSKDYPNVNFDSLFEPRKRAKNDEIKTIVNDYLIKNSSASRTSNKINNEQIYFLNNTKKSIYIKMKEENPQLKLSLSGFYKICGKNFKKPVKKTDICPICANGQLIEKKIRAEYMKQYIDEKQIYELQQQYETYNKHHKLAQYQREEHNKQIQSLGENACVVIMDFKQNLKIGGGRVETSRDFYTKSEITVLLFCVFIRINEKLIKKQISFVSETLSHDTHFVKSALKRLTEYEFLKDIEVMHFGLIVRNILDLNN